MLFLAFGVLTAFILGVLTRKHIKKVVLTIRYEAVYWLLGAAANADDIINRRKNRLTNISNRSGDVAIVTGGSRGIGFEVVKKLLEHGMHVVIACRDVKAGQKALETIRSQGIISGTGKVLELDTSKLSSVKKFTEQITYKYTKLHVLINNAGIMFVPHEITEDGFELHLAVNYLGHSLLTHLLLPLLKKTGNGSQRAARIVNVTSCAYMVGAINFDDIDYKSSTYIPSVAYSQSKLAQLMQSLSLGRQMRTENVRVFAVHPGIVNTELFKGTTLKNLLPWLMDIMFRTPEEGSRSIVFAALSDEMENRQGAYITNCRTMWLTSYPRDAKNQNRLMEITKQKLGITEFGNC